MKLQRYLTLLFAAFFVGLWIAPIHQALAQKERPDETEQKGRIRFDLPNAPEPKVEVNLTDNLINLVTKSMSAKPEVTELIQMIDGIYVRTYETTAADEIIATALVNYYQNVLKKNKWEVLVKIKESDEIVEISLLFDDDVAYGIFVIVVSSKPREVTFVNIVGEIAPDKISELLGNLSNFGMTDIDLDSTLKAKTASGLHSETSQKELLAVKVEKPPIIDGKLDDKCWKIAPQASGFTNVKTDKPVKDQTIVKIVYTDKSIYVAWHLSDSQPKKIVASQTKDNIRFANEDTVCFSIDPFHTHQSAHRTLFMANPHGKKYVQLASGRSKKANLSNRWKVASKIVDDGWVVEMQIPWQILDYPEATDPTQMGINFDRKQQRTGENSWWSNIGADKSYQNDGNWLRVLPPLKLSLMQGMLDVFEKNNYRESGIYINGNDVSPTSRNIFRLVNTSGLNSVDGLRLGGGFELGKQWYHDPLYFDRTGETIRRNVDANSASIEFNENNFGMWSRFTPNPFVYGSMSFSLRTKAPNYRFGGGATFGEKSNLTYSAQIHRLTSVRDRDILLSGGEQFWRAFFNSDVQDYYIRQGGVMALQWQNTTLKHTLGLSMLLEEHESIREASHSYFRIGNYQLDAPRENSLVYDGRMHSISLKYDFDTRENTEVRYDLENQGNKNEWYNTFLVEHSNSEIGSDYDFTRFSVHLRNYHPIGENRLDTRLKVGIASTSYMLPYQRQFVLGGTGTLRGYSLYEFEGNHGFLFNLEYVHSLAKSIYVVPFVDIGQAWHNLEDIKNVYPKVNLGIGFQLGIFRLNFARALERERGYQADFKWSRTF